MKRLRWVGPCAALLALASCVQAVEEKSALAQVPAQAPIVVQLRGFERTKGRLLTMIHNALPDYGPRVQEAIEEGLKSALMGRELKGLAPFGPVFLVVLEVPRLDGDAPPFAVLARVSDGAAFRKGLLKDEERQALKRDPAGYEVTKFEDTDLYLVEREGYLALTMNKDAALLFTKQRPGLDGKLTKEMAKRFLEADVSVYVDTAEVWKVYGDQIKEGRQLLEAALQMAGNATDKETMAMLRRFFDGAVQGLADSRGLLLTVDFRPEGLALHGEVRIAGDSKTNGLLKPLTPGDLKDVDTLPAGQMSYTAVRMDAGIAQLFNMFAGAGADPDSEQGKAMQKALDLLAAAGPQGLLQSASLSTHGVAISRYADPAKAVQGQLLLFRAMKEGQMFNRLALKKAEVKNDVQEHRGFKLHQAEFVWDFEKMIEDAQGAKEVAGVMKKLMGEGVRVWFGTDGKVMAQVTASDWAGAQKHLDAYLDGKTPIGQNSAFQDTRKQLPSQTNILALYDVPQLMQSLRDIMFASFKAMGLGDLKAPPADPKTKASYLGFAVTLRGEQAAFDLWLPVGVAKEVQKFVEPIIQLFGP